MYQPEQDFTGRYTLKERIGVGGFAEVWRAYDHTTKTDIALKILAPDTNLSREVIDQCSQEYTKTLNIRHTHLLTPNYFGIEQGKMFFIMPLCKAGSLGKRLYQSPLTEAEVWQVVKQVGQGLAYLHEHDLLHNDIKPDNILIAAKESYVLTDFGVSTRTRTTLRKYTRGQSQEAVGGFSMAYAAPELFGSQPRQSKATDIFSFGIMLYELVTGDLPFLGQGGIFLKNGADLPALPAGFSAKLQSLIQACLALDPNLRPAAADLRSWKSMAKQPIEYIEPKSKTTLLWILLLLLSLGAGFWAYKAYQSSKIEEDHRAYAQVLDQNDSLGYADYLRDYPTGLHTATAKTKLDSITNTLAQQREQRRIAEQKAEAKRIAEQKAEAKRIAEQKAKAEREQRLLRNGITIQGQNYKVVKIGNQIWLAENLNFYIDGSSCYDDNSSNCTKYGRLYSWEAAKKVAAKIPGWHLPTDAEWTTLTNYLGSNAGTKLKKNGESGFEALPAGYRPSGGLFRLGHHGYFWSASPSGSSSAWIRRVGTSYSHVDRYDTSRMTRFSVRLVKD